MDDFTIDIDETIAEMGRDHEWIGLIGSVRFTENEEGDMEVEIDHVARIPWQYKKFENVFNGTYADSLPPHRSFDHAIDLKPGKEPPFGPLYSLSQKELEILREYLKKMLASGKISPSKSPAGSPVLFVPKPHGRGLRLCVDYRGLNKVTIANR